MAPTDVSGAVLASAGLLLQALRSLHAQCQQVRDRPLATLQLHARLHQVFLRVASGARSGSLPSDFELSRFTTLLTTFRALIEQHARLRNVLARLLASRRLLAGLVHVHHELDGIIARYDLAAPGSAILEWKTQFATNQQQDEKALHTTMMSLLSTSFLPKEYASERRQALVLMELVCEFAPERERADRHSPHLLETFKMLHKRISNHCGLHLRRVPRWFLPTSEVDFTLKEHTIGHGGSFATTLHRGELFRGGKRSSTVATAIATAGGHRREYMSIAAVTSTSTVAVKCLWVLKDVHFSHIEELLAPFVPLWRLANHPNVVSFQGACHAASPPYLVRNYTAYGNLTSYLTALQSRTNSIPDSNSKMMSLTWQLLYMASRGIIYLHEQRQIVHGGLRCNNILVNKKGHAVVADYGLYAVACEVRSRNLTDHFVKQDADCEEIIRWQAPECLREEEAFRESLASLPDSGPSSQASTVVPPAASSSAFSTDVYAFGMCILEAFTREVPWADLEIAEIRSIKLNLGLLPPRPKHMSSRAWTLIQKMCDPDPAKRITMREVSQELKWFGYGDRRDKKAAIEMKQAGSAQTIPTSTESQDSSVGDKENSPAAINDQNSRSRGSSVQEDQVSSRRSSAAEEPRVISRSNRSSSAASLPPTAKSRASTADHSSETAHPVEGEVVSRSKRSSSTSSHHRRDSERPRSSAKTEPSRKGSENIWACDVPEKSEVKPSNRYRRSSSSGSLDTSFTTVKAASGQREKSGSKTTHRSSSTSSASKSRQLSNKPDKEQPERELESTVRARQSSTESRSSRMSRSSSATKLPGQEALALSDEETDGVSSGGSDNGAWAPTSVPAEFMTARSSDIEEETGELEEYHGQPRDELANILDNLKIGSQNEPRLVEDLERLHALLEGTSVERIIQLDGILILLEIVWRGYSARASKLSLEFLLAMITLDPDCIPTIVNFEVIKILTAVIKHRPSPEEVEVAATFLLEIIVASDPAKDQFCTSGGVAIVEANDVINRRFVQELKSILAKFKRNEGYKCLDEGEFNLAIEKFSDAITLDRKRSCYYADRSLAYLEASMYKKAAEDAARSMRYNPYDVIGYLRHGLALKAMGRYNEALVSLRKGRQVDPKFTKLVDIIAELESQRSGELHSDARGTRRLTRAEAANAKKKEGDIALRRKEYQLAIAKYTEAIGLDEKNDGIYLHRSIAFAGYGQYGRAIDDASKCIQINYRQIEGYYRLALAFHAAGQRDQALNTLYRGHEIDTTHNGITRLIAQLEEQEAAEAGMTLPLWYKEKGYRAFQLRSYEDAVRFYTKAIDASPAEDDDITQHCYFYRSRANQCRGEFAAVIADCSYLLACNPKNAFARLRRADAYEQQRDYYMALQDIRELVIFNPEYEDAQARLKSLEHRCRLLPEAPGHQAIIDL